MHHSISTSKVIYSMLPYQLGGSRPHDRKTSSPPLWHPFVLSLGPSLIFGLVLLGAVAGLEVFVRLSDLHTGFPVPTTTLQNLATYLPIASVIVIGWVWQAYAVEVKKLAPWASMSAGPVPSDASVQLDYTGANPLVAMALAIRKRHYSILVSTLGTLAVAVCSIVAASIWDIEPTPRVLPASLQRSGTYNGSSLEGTADIAHSLSRYLARTVLQLPTPSWITDDYVISPFNSSSIEPGMILSGTTQGYNANLTCEKADVSLSNNGTNVTITYAGVSQMVPCDVFVDEPGNWTYTADPYLYTGKVYNWTVGSSTPAVLLATQLLPPNNCAYATAVGCVASYTVRDVVVSVDAETAAFNRTPRAAGTASSVSFPGGGYLLQTIDNNNGVTGSPWNSEAQGHADNDDPFAYIPWSTSPPDIKEVGNYSPWFHLLRHLLLLDPQQLMDAEAIAQGSQKIFSDIWRNVIQPTSASGLFQGTAAVADQRLSSRVGSVRAIQVCLCVLAVIAVFVVLWRPRACLPRDPSSLGSIALILAESEGLARRLEGTGAAKPDALDSHVRDSKYQLAVDPNGTVGIMVVSNETDADSSASASLVPPNGSEHRFDWTPPVLYPVAKLALAVIVLALIAVLELLVQLSSKRSGLVDFNGHRAQRYAWSYAGPVILFLVGLGIEIFDSAVRAMHPFVLLRRAPQSGNRLTYDPLHQSVITLPFHALRHRQPMVLISTLAVLLLLVAKIAVAGLFTIDQVTRVTSVQVGLNTTFAWNNTALADTMATGITAPLLNPNIPGYESGDDSYEVPPLQLIVNAGLQTPNWTAPKIAVGALSADPNFQYLPASSRLTARLPVLHSDLVNCTAPPYIKRGGNASTGTFVVLPQIPCVADYGGAGTSGLDYVVTLDETSYAGAVFPVPGRSDGNDVQLNCSTIFFLFVRSDDINLIACNYTMTQSTMEVDLAIDSPTGYHVLAVNRASEQDITTIDEFSQMPLIFSGLPSLDSITDLAYTRNNSANEAFSGDVPYELFHSGPFDYLFTAITANMSDMDSLLDQDSLITAVQSQWSQYFARLADFYMRVPADGKTAVSSVLAAPQQRIFIEPKPARILEGLLAGIFVCVVTVSFTLKTTGVLPRPPYSIASRMSLLAGSELLNLPELKEPGSQQVSTNMLEKRLQGTWFKLGWWEDATDGKGLRYGIDVDGADRDTEVLDDYAPGDLQSPQAETYELRPNLPVHQRLGRSISDDIEKLVSPSDT
ncbi:uncharacterized protein B0H18DRAFT_138450 [Fomitopsis serialis]|uniref:uncharacterized protein n=1 Tax=Fomitopsis serialis TaxID=139415 RepID=UPI002007E24B|nr:uncharacterized protein B0H18DRAFT_138450 [Neoantrodia serialis]KAH9914288.1 hypothetical protein B0H18DRAFT_138450 [Neoantrodia serialis]